MSGSGQFPDVTRQRIYDARSVLDQDNLEKVLAGGAIIVGAGRLLASGCLPPARVLFLAHGQETHQVAVPARDPAPMTSPRS